MYKNLKYYVFLHLYTLLSSFIYFYTFSYISLKLVHIYENLLENIFNFFKCIKMCKNV